MFRFVPAVLAGVLACALPSAASADRIEAAHVSAPHFGYLYTAETEEAGETELALWATDRRGRGGGHYDAQDYRLEVERGLTERLQASVYVNFAGHHVRGPDASDKRIDRGLAFQGMSAEFIYSLRAPTNGRIGLAVYAEPGWSRIHKGSGERGTEYELELKAIAQKNFAHDRLVWVANLTLEPEWEREAEEPGESEWEQELGVELASGLSYRVAPQWWVGVESRYHSSYPDWTRGLQRKNYAVYAGPSVHLNAGEWSATATWLPQLIGGPSEPGTVLEFEDHEKREFRLKISREF